MVTHLFTCVVALGLGLFIELGECTPTLIFDRQGVTPTDPNRNRVDLVCREDGADINATFWNGTTQLNPLPSPTHTHDLTADTEAEIVCSNQDGLMSGEIRLAALPEEQNLQDNPPRTKFVRRGETVELPCDYRPGNLRKLYEVFWSVHELGGSDVIYRPNALPLGDLLSIDEDTFALTVAVNRTGDQYHCIVDVRLNNIGTRRLRYQGATIELTDEALTATVEPTANSDSDSPSDDSVLSEEVRTVIFVLAGIVAFVIVVIIVVISCVCSLRILYKQGKITTDSRVIRNRPLLQRMVSGERYPRITHSPNEYHDYEHMDAELGSLRPGSEVPAHFFQPSDVSDQEEVYNLSRGSGGSSVFLPRHTPSVSIPGSQTNLQQPFDRISYPESESEHYQKLFPNKEGRERRASQISTQSTGNLSAEVRVSPAPNTMMMLPGYPTHVSPKITAIPESASPTPLADEILRHVVGCLMHREDCQIPHCPCRDVQQRYRELLMKDISATQEPPKPPPYDNKNQHLHLSLSQQNVNSNEHHHWHLHTKSHIHRTQRKPLLRQRSKSVDLTPIIEMRETPVIEKRLTPTPIDEKRVLRRASFKFQADCDSPDGQEDPNWRPPLLREISLSADNLPALCLNDCPLTPSPLRENRTLVAAAMSPLREQRSRWVHKPKLDTLTDNSLSVDVESSSEDGSNTSSRSVSAASIANEDITKEKLQVEENPSTPKQLHTSTSVPESDYDTNYSDTEGNSNKLSRKHLHHELMGRLQAHTSPQPPPPPADERDTRAAPPPMPAHLQGRSPTHQQGHSPTHQQGRSPTRQQEYGHSHLREHSPTYLQICSPTHQQQRSRTHSQGYSPNHLRGHSPTHHYTKGNSNKLSHRQEAFNVSSHIMHVSNSDFNEATITSASSYGQITNVSIPITDTVKYGSAGGMYINQIHDVTIQIPEKAVPKGTYFQLSISAMLHGHFLFPEGVQPVSPIIWLCPQPVRSFLKPIEVVLPHYLYCENQTDTEHLIFMKANHNPINGKFHFKPADGESIFKHHTSYGTLHTTHCCFLCITTKTTERETPKINFSLITAYPRNPQEHSWSVYFGVTVLLSSCMQTFKRQFKAADYQINNPQIFTMQDTAEKKIKICYQEHLPQQWMAGLSGSDEVLASEVDFWNYTPTDLKTMEDEKMYPPRFEVLIDGRSAIGDSMLTVNFSGIKKKLMVKIPLRPTTGAQAKLPDREPITPITDEQNDTIELKELCLELQTVDDWFDLGVYLHIPYSKLKIIEVEYQNTHRRRTEMLQAWLNNFQPSWSTVIEALKLIDMSQLAKKLAAKKKIPGPTYRLTQYNPTHHYRTSSTGHGTRGRSPLHLPEPLASETLC